jgi:hypothetical protein
MTGAQAIREYVRDHYIEPARSRGDSTIRVPVRDVSKGLRLSNQFPNVCNALRGKRFLQANALELVESSGPPSGMGSTVVYTYRLISSRETEAIRESTFDRLRGIGREVFASLGGGEAYLRGERDNFYGASEESGEEPRR